MTVEHEDESTPRGATPGADAPRTFGEMRPGFSMSHASPLEGFHNPGVLGETHEDDEPDDVVSPFPLPGVPESGNRVPEPPEGLDADGVRLWRDVLGRYELEAHEAALLVEAARSVTTLNRLDALVRAEGEVIESPQGRKAHPALVERRNVQLNLARLLAALRMPTGDEDEGTQATARPKRRKAPTGPYRITAPGARKAQ